VSQANIVVSPDSGVSNLAATLDIPVVTIFSNRNKANFEKMFNTMVGVQGDCPNRKENYCDFFVPCLGTGAHRPKENIRIPDCMLRLSSGKVLKAFNYALNKFGKKEVKK